MKVTHVADVKQIKTPIGQDDLMAASPPLTNELSKFGNSDQF